MDTLVAWYAVRRGTDAPARRVLLPRSFDVRDASDTHVWGVRKDELGVDHVLGRRLVGPSEPKRGVSLIDPGGADAWQPSPRDWTTQVDHRIDDSRHEDEGFDSFTRVRVGAGGTRVVTTDGVRSGLVRVWAPDGTLLLSVRPAGRSTGTAVRIRADSHGFRVDDPGTGRTTGYGYDGEEASDTISAPEGFEHFVPTARGGFAGLGNLPHWKDFAEDPSARRQAAVHVMPAGAGVRVDTLAMIDLGNAGWYVGIGDGASGNPADHSVVSVTQPFPDHDLTWFDAETGSVGVVRRSGPPGEVELFRVVTTGDTTWHRRLALPATPVPDEDAKQAVEGNFERFRRVAEKGGLDVTLAEVRAVAEAAVHVPSHLPAVTGVVAAASGEIWLETPEGDGELSVWYSLRPDDRDSPPRRVLIPSDFRLMDAFDDHVWGLSKGSQGAWIVQALRLLPPRP